MSQHYLHDALATRLVAIQSSGSPPIAGENENYEPAVGTLYLKEHLIPTGTDPIGTGDDDPDKLRGIYQVTVCAEAGTMRGAAQEQARLVAAHFPKGGEYTSGGVTARIRRVEVARGFTADGWYKIPVSIYYQSII